MWNAPIAARPSTKRKSNWTAKRRTRRTDFQQDMQDLYTTLASKVYDVMQSYAEAQGFTLVLDVSTTAIAGALRERRHQHHQNGDRCVQPQVWCACSLRLSQLQPAGAAPKPRGLTPPTSHSPSAGHKNSVSLMIGVPLIMAAEDWELA